MNRELALQGFIKADNLLVESDFMNAKQSFIALMENPFFTQTENNWIASRAEYAGALDLGQDSLSENLEVFKSRWYKAQQENKLLRETTDSLDFRLKKLNQEYDQALQSAQNEIAQLKSELNKKENIQVLSFVNQNGNQIYYLGEVKNGKANGGGIGIWNTGGIYKGEWKDNMRHGEGHYTWKDGHQYVGTFVNGIREGQGVYTWSSGERYEGAWSNNKRNGYGVMYDKDNNVQFKGEWEDDKVKKS